jgi:hypothetical protein
VYVEPLFGNGQFEGRYSLVCYTVFPVPPSEDSMLKSELLRLLQQEIRRHDFSTFIDQPPSVAQGGRGVCVPGCPACKVRINTMPQFLDHLANDVLPKVIESLKP